ncbi:MAG: universal stress protein [Burkholderiales bacterium]|nr:universal stress protein [Burkholderiales bacterium]
MKLLVAIDGSAGALRALRWAMELAAAGLPCEFVLANVQEPASLYEVMTAHDAERIEAVRRSAGADLLREAEALLEAAGHGFESEVAGGAPENLIVELAENYGCGLVVMGARGAGHPEGVGLGKVALAVASTATMPVTLVRAGEGAEADADGAAAVGDA